MIAGGTGITPMYQVAQTVLRDSSDRTTFSLLFANVAPEDILIKEELDKLAAAYPGRFKVGARVAVAMLTRQSLSDASLLRGAQARFVLLHWVCALPIRSPVGAGLAMLVRYHGAGGHCPRSVKMTSPLCRCEDHVLCICSPIARVLAWGSVGMYLRREK